LYPLLHQINPTICYTKPTNKKSCTGSHTRKSQKNQRKEKKDIQHFAMFIHESKQQESSIKLQKSKETSSASPKLEFLLQ